MLKEIKKVLEEFNYPVYYGLLTQTNMKDLKEWNYFVFRKKSLNKKGVYEYTDYYTIAIIQEDYIEEDYVDKVIEKLKNIQGLRVEISDIGFEYFSKPNTDMVCEVALFNVYRARKKMD